MPTEILQFTDLHIPPHPGQRLWGIDPMARLRSAFEHARRHHPRARLALLTGDLVHEPCASAYARLDGLLAAQPWPCWALPGNHDDPKLMRAVLQHALLAQRGAAGVWRLHLLDSAVPGESGGRLTGDTLGRLSRHLAAEPEAPALIFLHHHTLPVGSPWLDRIMLDDAASLAAALTPHAQVRAVLWGHTHQAFEGRLGCIPAFGTPSTAMQFRPRSRTFTTEDRGAGYRWLRLHRDGRLETRIHYVAGPQQA